MLQPLRLENIDYSSNFHRKWNRWANPPSISEVLLSDGFGRRSGNEDLAGQGALQLTKSLQRARVTCKIVETISSTKFLSIGFLKEQPDPERPAAGAFPLVTACSACLPAGLRRALVGRTQVTRGSSYAPSDRRRSASSVSAGSGRVV